MKKLDASRPARLRLLSTADLGLRSASAIAPLGGALALVVDDDEGLYLVGAQGAPRLLRGRRDARELGDLEGVCVSGDGATAYAVSENDGRVVAFDVVRAGDDVTLGKPDVLGVLPRPGDAKNKGWEGVAWLAGAFTADGAPRLVAVHERKPMAVGVFTLPDLREETVIELRGPFRDLLDDVADVAACPATGHLFLLSDESRRVVEARLDDDRLDVLGSTDVAVRKNEKPEGIAFESDDRLVIVTDATGRLLRYAVER